MHENAAIHNHSTQGLGSESDGSPDIDETKLSPLSLIRAAIVSNSPEIDFLRSSHIEISLAELQLRTFARQALFSTLLIILPVSVPIYILYFDAPRVYWGSWVSIYIIGSIIRAFHFSYVGLEPPNKVNLSLHYRLTWGICLFFALLWASLSLLGTLYVDDDAIYLVLFCIITLMVGTTANYFTMRWAVLTNQAIVGFSTTLCVYTFSPSGALAVLLFSFWLMATTYRNSVTFDADVASRKLLRSEHAKLELALRENSNSPVWLWSTDKNLLVEEFSPGGCDFFDHSPQSILNENFIDAVSRPQHSSSKFTSARLKALSLAMQTKRIIENEIVPLIGQGGVRWFSITAEPKYDNDGTYSGYKGLLRDSTAVEKQSKASVPVDYQTGLRQTASLFPRINEKLVAAASGRENLAILAVRTSLGKAAYQRYRERGRYELMRQTARSLGEIFDAEDLTVLDDKTFIVVLDRWLHVDDLQEIYSDLAQSLTKTYSVRGFKLEHETLLGLATGPTINSSPQVLIKNCLSALEPVEPNSILAGSHAAGDSAHLPITSHSNNMPGYNVVLDTDSGNISHIITNYDWDNFLGQPVPPQADDFLELFKQSVSIISRINDVGAIIPISLFDPTTRHLANELLEICRSLDVETDQVILTVSPKYIAAAPEPVKHVCRQLRMAGFQIFCRAIAEDRCAIFDVQLDGIILDLVDISSDLAHEFSRNHIISVQQDSPKFIPPADHSIFKFTTGNQAAASMQASEIREFCSAYNLTQRT